MSSLMASLSSGTGQRRGANAAGDNYSVREAQFADGACMMISALFGGVVPNTV